MENINENYGQNALHRLAYLQSLLKQYLYDYYPELLTEEDFIKVNVANAEVAYQEIVEKGYDVNTALEYAQHELFSGLGFPKFSCLKEIVEENFSSEIPEEKSRDFCVGLLPECEAIFQKYRNQETEDFSNQIRMEAEIVGLIDGKLSNGLQ